MSFTPPVIDASVSRRDIYRTNPSRFWPIWQPCGTAGPPALKRVHVPLARAGKWNNKQLWEKFVRRGSRGFVLFGKSATFSCVCSSLWRRTSRWEFDFLSSQHFFELWSITMSWLPAADQWSRCRFMDGKITQEYTFFLVHIFRHFDLFAQFIINTTLFFRLVTASLQSWVRVLLWSLMWQVQGWVWSHLPVDASHINNKVLILTCMKLVSYVAAELYSCISPVHVAPPCGCILTVQLVAELGLWFQLFAFIIFVSFSETLPWRRVADLHVLISSAISAMLGWTLYKEQITQIFQKEEGRYATPHLIWEKQTVYAFLGSPFKKMCCLSDGITIMKLHFIKGILLYHYSLILYETLM